VDRACDGRGKRLVQCLFRQAEVAEQADQRGGRVLRFGVPDLPHDLLRVRCRRVRQRTVSGKKKRRNTANLLAPAATARKNRPHSLKMINC
jgi:hypothetical protein